MLGSLLNEVIFLIASSLSSLERYRLARTDKCLLELLSATIINVPQAARALVAFNEFVAQNADKLDWDMPNYDPLSAERWRAIYLERQVFEHWEFCTQKSLKGLKGFRFLSTFEEAKADKDKLNNSITFVKSYIMGDTRSTEDQQVTVMLRKIAAKDLVSPKKADKEWVSYVENFDLKQFRVLLGGGANINAYSSNGNSVLHWALQRKNFKFIDFMHDAECHPDLQLKNKQGNTALHLAASCGPDVLSKVLDFSFLTHQYINIQNKAGKTALHIAAESQDEKAVRRLINRGANKDVVDAGGKTYQAYFRQ